ncbi:hypothetical protein [Salinibacter altiplanensis]|uniref:hypothetical protein n=1 Tax=Salinibacter altiplanensis TaxID=1803181 RepID=UPI000C9ED915|nr:hypothetical protein [Salinibacter altiplanensis]
MHTNWRSVLHSTVDITLLAAALLMGHAAGVGPSAAQHVQIDQVRQATGQVEGASQAKVLVATGDEVSSDQILNLVQDVAPSTAAGGNSAAVRQDGSRNDVAIRQAGTGNRTVAEQLGSDNAIAIMQDGGGSVPFAFEDNLSNPEAAFEALRRLRPVGEGTGNLAVAVHDGSNNRTGIVQRGTDNRAGIRLVGTSNTMTLVQAGNENQFLMDATVSNQKMSVVQNGNGNSLQSDLPVSAEMNGTGIELVIRRDALGPLSLE